MRRILSIAAILLIPSVAPACVWDYDTLKQERARFPDTLEIITGKFLRHSPEFYEWRIKDRLQKLKSDPRNPNLHDDLAVAYAKTNQYAKAIATMEALEKIAPGRYETYSNLGTFYFLAGDIAKALPIIDKALAINPDAHFGREKYQRWFGEYVLTRTSDARAVKLPLYLEEMSVEDRRARDFSVYIQRKLDTAGRLSDESRADAIRGVLGMMRFADHASPMLLEVLGDLLSDGFAALDGKRLAGRAFIRASHMVQEPNTSTKYLNRATFVLNLQTRHPATQEKLPLSEVQVRFAEELADAENWYAELKAQELSWIASGADPEVEFDKLYADQPHIADEPTDEMSRPWYLTYKSKLAVLGTVGGIAILLLIAAIAFRRFSRRA
jgi:tetratricopeptide (TPR) repeat protein